VWERAADGVIECTLITAPALAPVVEVHDRMPIPIAERSRDAWIDPRIVSVDEARALAVVDPAHALVRTAVSTFVNDARHEGPECLAPAAQQALF
jgi:putative SOS response-associated peptidase YedK